MITAGDVVETVRNLRHWAGPDAAWLPFIGAGTQGMALADEMNGIVKCDFNGQAVYVPPKFLKVIQTAEEAGREWAELVEDVRIALESKPRAANDILRIWTQAGDNTPYQFGYDFEFEEKMADGQRVWWWFLDAPTYSNNESGHQG